MSALPFKADIDLVERSACAISRHLLRAGAFADAGRRAWRYSPRFAALLSDRSCNNN